MQFKNTILALSISLLLISCGDNTIEPITSDVSKIEIDKIDTPIYSTDETALSASVFYRDNTYADATYNVTWINSDFNVTTLNKNLLIPIVNRGTADISISYENMNHTIAIEIIGLKDINNSWRITTENINTTGDFKLSADGNFSDGSINKPIIYNLIWTSSNSDDIITLDEEDNSININISTTGERNITATLFDVNKTVTYTVY